MEVDTFGIKIQGRIQVSYRVKIVLLLGVREGSMRKNVR